MRPTQRVQNVEGSLDGQVIEMGIDENSLAHIMTVLTDLYSDTELAVIREYSCNARDSHIEAGNSAPIEIMLPSTFAHDFVVRDYGVGLSVDEISAIYSRYGASTKRGTDAQTGMLGLGCKSALTYAPSFQVTSWKNGVKVQVLVSRNADGVGIMEVIDTSASDEPTGVEIRVPVQARNSFTQKVKDFFRFWKPGTVLVNGSEPDFIKGTWISDEFLITPNVSQDIVVMGGVSYPASTDRYKHAFSGDVRGYVVHFAEIGAVNFTPAREELMFSAKTKGYLLEAKSGFDNALQAAYDREISTVTTHHEAFRVAAKWRAISSAFRPEYQGGTIPDHFRTTSTAFHYDPSGYSRAQKGSVRESQHYTAEILATSIFVTNTNVKGISPGMKDRVEKWAADNSIDFDHVIFTDVVFGQPWVEPVAIVDYDTVKAVKVPRAQATAASTATRVHPYDLLLENGTLEETSTISSKVVYGSPTDFPAYGRQGPTRIRQNLFAVMETLGYQVVLIGKNRWEKFQRDFPTAQRVDEFALGVWNKRLTALSEGARIRFGYNHDDTILSDFLFSRRGEILDTVIATTIALASDAKAVADVKAMDEFAEQLEAAGLTGRRPYGVNGMEWGSPVPANTSRVHASRNRLFILYPMCYTHGKNHAAHHVAYINAVHKEDN